jgi:hypothetical protein
MARCIMAKGTGMRMRHVIEPKKPAEYILPEEMDRKLAELRELQKPKRLYS